MRTELQFSPVLGYIGSFAPKSFTFEQPTTIELDGHIPGLNEPDPSPQNTVFPSRSLAYEQASIAFDGTTFVLTPEDELAENICVNGYLLQDQAHVLQDGDVLQFGSYMRKEHRFKTDCAAKVSFRLSPGASPTGTNWAGIRQLVSDLQREQAQAQQGHQSAGRKTPFKIASSQNLTQSPGQIQIPPKASKDGFSDGSFAAVLRELRHTSAFLCSKFDAMLGPVPASESASTPSVVNILPLY
ncbi:unnamed protein product [Tilletia controversa]|uniref:FHA domain-containing protein n=1 Tax=Tilletia controversa TaxID=13291 RepID=A0A8X7SS60_9BASI|nr:hypothetical protein CF328_g6995 [Tilletia controversa]KAE8236503.1 hypothetical protein A4X06_0g9528 [Tilletia controversa]CAD6919867.1 unnamed protein product [Tilletia controversa]CAD6960465.1 unnamed protein product [Tilletia controversa]CAD6977956.1 unnamed protein product [Tilletia controversa]